ncbi:pimeloyl-ACP methyl ester carboxylesterase [Pararhizobium capsulatum DSM 1112]|uniref:Pimeloyl-ACP methyl ester carboxylesterase n=1 Tax=Pararhizobium capsulatum DSM 1112 TaxID=1121113 RepID=A0ABU0BV18_9HYPH|nr:alpha/beta hydrolase [Pararhizobium capsulatum]MDQ0322092.1 pimeloyl-ACP methyl ester carboxylesterase [Pararhizobium capsulatum DSM 1112]
MLRLIPTLAAILVLCGFSIVSSPAVAQDNPPIQVTSGIEYQFLERWDVDRLNQILKVDTPKFAGIPVSYSPASNAVRLYRVTYLSVIPEHGNTPIVATGLIAIPETADKEFPIVSYQHGTVYGKKEVPSFPEQSPETELMIAQFAGQGYILIGPDYFGLGSSDQPDSYLVKGSHQQATVDMLTASQSVLDHLDLRGNQLFLAGWSQGGFVTMAALERLESSGVPVQATATASAPIDIFVALNGVLNFPRKNDAPWLTTIVILSSFSFENYYRVPGLARSVINDEYYEVSRKAYERQPFNPADVPTDVHKLVRAEYFDPQFFAASAYGRLLQEAQAYRWVIKTPVRNYYGGSDEAVSVGLGQLAMTYQHAIGAGNQSVEAISTGSTTHRGTFATAVPLWKNWFDTLSK